MFCNIENPDGTPYIKDCRSKLQKAIKAMKEEFNCELKIGSEIEFYLFRLDENDCPTCNPFDHAGYMDGMRNNMVSPSPVLSNTYIDENCEGLELIPDTYDLAKQIASESDFIKEILEK